MLVACVAYVALALGSLYFIWLFNYRPAKAQSPTAHVVSKSKIQLKAFAKPVEPLEVEELVISKKENRKPRFVEDGSFVINFKASRLQVRNVLSQLNPNSQAFSPIIDQAKLNPEAQDFHP